MRISPQLSHTGRDPVNLQLRWLLARQQVRALAQERYVQNPDVRAAMGAISLIAGGLIQYKGNVLGENQMMELLDLCVGKEPVDRIMFQQDIEVNVNQLFLAWPNNFPVQPNEKGLIIINRARWETWLALLVRDVDPVRSDQNVFQDAPAACNPAPQENELHPWALGGILDINTATGAAVQGPVVIPAYLAQLIALAGAKPTSAAARQNFISALALGVTIVTSGGNITQSNLRKIITKVKHETNLDNVDFTREQVMKGWDILNNHLAPQGLSSHDFAALFAGVRTVVQPISLQLALLCDKTELKMLTGINTVIRAINSFPDFPWTELNLQIIRITGRDEMATVKRFSEYINPQQPAPVAQGAAAGGHWTGWAYALRQENPGNFTNSNICNLLYTALRLCTTVEGDTSLLNYQGLSNQTIYARPLINEWVQAYQTKRLQRDHTTQFPAQIGDPSADV
ncbi:uncharacterized protein [Paramisgurnus dabryanus]|uniref:uncharacterized protein n=1 Tax=Paramisgurnus dabryanus TaxID=90735 RepID=UPI0031F45945